MLITFKKMLKIDMIMMTFIKIMMKINRNKENYDIEQDNDDDEFDTDDIELRGILGVSARQTRSNASQQDIQVFDDYYIFYDYFLFHFILLFSFNHFQQDNQVFDIDHHDSDQGPSIYYVIQIWETPPPSHIT